MKNLILYVPAQKARDQGESFIVYTRIASGDWRCDGTLGRVDEFNEIPTVTETGPAPLDI